jgi:hypothetical protein
MRAGSDDPRNRRPLRKAWPWEASLRLKTGRHPDERASLLPTEADASLSCPLARIILTERANLIIIPFVQEYMTVRAKILILRNSWSADVEKSHGCLLCHTPLTRAGTGLTHA